MPTCQYCGSSILFGGRDVDGRHFCNDDCLKNDVRRQPGWPSQLEPPGAEELGRLQDGTLLKHLLSQYEDRTAAYERFAEVAAWYSWWLAEGDGPGELYVATWNQAYDTPRTLGYSLWFAPLLLVGMSIHKHKTFVFSTSHRFERQEVVRIRLRRFVFMLLRVFAGVLAVFSLMSSIITAGIWLTMGSTLAAFGFAGSLLILYSSCCAYLALRSAGLPATLAMFSSGYFEFSGLERR